MHILKIILLSALGVAVAAVALFVFVVNRRPCYPQWWEG